MPHLFRRETFIALRARRQAYAIARDILNPHVAVWSVPCRACGHEVQIEPHVGAAARCPACDAEVLLPANLVAKERPTPHGVTRRPLRFRDGINWGACILLGVLIGSLMMLLAIAFAHLQ